MNVARIAFAILAVCPIWAQSTLVVSGRITDAVSGVPVAEAAITLDQNGADGFHQILFTDQGGNFSFDEVAPGAGRVQIQKEGYIPFQKSNPAETSIQIAADHAELNFKLTPAASIIGRIVGEDGTPEKGIVATLLAEDFTGGVARYMAVASNSRPQGMVPDGLFTFTGLEPGKYIVSARYSQSQTRISGFTCNVDGQCMELKADGDRGSNSPTEGYVTSYYPGTTGFADALAVNLVAGEKRVMDFRMAKRSLFRVSGEIYAPGVTPPVVSVATNLLGGPIVDRAAAVQLAPSATISLKRTDGGPGESAIGGAFAVPGPFTFSGLPAGQYTASAFGLQGDLSFAITDHDVDGLKLVLHAAQKQLTVEGSFRMANSGAALPAGLSVHFAWPLPGESTPTSASETGHFLLSALPGDYSVLPVVPVGYAATELRYGGANYLNSLIPMHGDSLDSSLVIVLTDKPGAVAGSIVDGEQKPIPAKIVLVPDPLPSGFDLWAIRVVSNDKQGAFAFSGLAPGRYKAVALTGDDRKRDHDLAILGDRLRAAEAFEVVAGQSVTVEVRP